MSDIKFYRYYLPSVAGEDWAEVILCSSGMFAACSDRGNYAYRGWSYSGDVREWIIEVAKDPEYLMGKLWSGHPKEYDGDATLKAVREHIDEAERCGGLDGDNARRERELVDCCNDLSCEQDFSEWCQETDLDDAAEFRCTRYPNDLRVFCERVMPRVATAIRGEIDAERRT